MAAAAYASDTVSLAVESPKPAPALVFKSADGAFHPLNPGKDKLTAVHFWATWCVPCLAELPQVDAAAKAYGGQGFRVVAISLDNDIGKVAPFFAARHITQLVPYADMGTASFVAAHLQGLPGTLFIDKNGREIARAEGPLDWKSAQVTGFIASHLTPQ
ncbi:MAG: TlpA family protein disulfide reductase [Pseudomonadota bacterium]|nr:TlpA family protein disulfide reductase [Pseudomonadota bacterium]MDE3038852.1 TlpA family protein disulfide reductase [Pseudomonadota bacterium]